MEPTINEKIYRRIKGAQAFDYDYENDIEACMDFLVPTLMGYHDNMEIMVRNVRGENFKLILMWEVKIGVLTFRSENLAKAISLTFIANRPEVNLG